MNRHELIALAIGVVAALLAIVIPVVVVSANSTERLAECVASGGAYLNVPNTSRMECQR